MYEDFSKPKKQEAPKSSQGLGAIAIMLALFAFSLSVSTPWVMESYAPEPPEPAVKVITPNQFDTVTNSIMGWVFGMPEQAIEENTAPPDQETPQEAEEPREEHWTDHWSMSVTILALFGIFFSVIALLQRESKAIAFTAMFFATGAIVAQHIMVAIIVGIIFVLIIGLLSAMGVSFGG